MPKNLDYLSTEQPPFNNDLPLLASQYIDAIAQPLARLLALILKPIDWRRDDVEDRLMAEDWLMNRLGQVANLKWRSSELSYSDALLCVQ
jgi:hypothetical protein